MQTTYLDSILCTLRRAFPHRPAGTILPLFSFVGFFWLFHSLKNIIRFLVSLELLILAVNLLFIVTAVYAGEPMLLLLVPLVLALAACETVVGLGQLVTAVTRSLQTRRHDSAHSPLLGFTPLLVASLTPRSILAGIRPEFRRAAVLFGIGLSVVLFKLMGKLRLKIIDFVASYKAAPNRRQWLYEVARGGLLMMFSPTKVLQMMSIVLLRHLMGITINFPWFFFMNLIGYLVSYFLVLRFRAPESSLRHAVFGVYPLVLIAIILGYNWGFIPFLLPLPRIIGGSTGFRICSAGVLLLVGGLDGIDDDETPWKPRPLVHGPLQFLSSTTTFGVLWGTAYWGYGTVTTNPPPGTTGSWLRSLIHGYTNETVQMKDAHVLQFIKDNHLENDADGALRGGLDFVMKSKLTSQQLLQLVKHSGVRAAPFVATRALAATCSIFADAAVAVTPAK